MFGTAEAAGKQNIAFICHFLLGRLDECVDLLMSCGRLPEAAFFARTYAPSRMTEVRRPAGAPLAPRWLPDAARQAPCCCLMPGWCRAGCLWRRPPRRMLRCLLPCPCS